VVGEQSCRTRVVKHTDEVLPVFGSDDALRIDREDLDSRSSRHGSCACAHYDFVVRRLVNRCSQRDGDGAIVSHRLLQASDQVHHFEAA
jgi:hypothetical protein